MSKLEELRARKAEREAAAANAAELVEVEALEQDEKLAASGQTNGVDYAVVTSLVGAFVVRKPDFLVAKKFNAAKDASIEDAIQFVVPLFT